jgi:hypothetical protein
MIHSGNSTGIADYVNEIKEHVLYDQTIIKLPKLQVYSLEEGREVLQDTLNLYPHDVLHIQYDENMFASEHCKFEQLENVVWLIKTSHSAGKRVVITLHGIQNYRSGEGFIQKISTGLLRRYWTNSVLPAWRTCDIIVHTHEHKKRLHELGCDTNVHVIPPSTPVHSLRREYRELTQVNMVVPGTRSHYKNYDQAIQLLSLLPDNYHLYVSDTGDINDQNLANHTNRHAVTDRLHLVSFSTNKQQYLKQLEEYDIALLPYTQNVPSSGSLNDCLSIGLYCVTSSQPGFVEINNSHACIISCYDFPVTANLLIRRIINDHQYREKLEKNMQLYRETVSAENIRRQMMNVYTPPHNMNPRIKPSGEIINVFMCCRDNQDTITETFNGLAACEACFPDKEFRYYILENDSVDQTPDFILQFYKTSLGNFQCATFGNTNWPSSPGVGRMRDMAMYRNMMKDLCTDWTNSQYSFIIDSEIQFEDNIIKQQIEYMDSNLDVAMVTPYGTVGSSAVYYDKFAYRDMDNLQSIDNVSDRVRSAFGGFVCIRTPVLERCHWSCIDGDTSEHVPFCDMVRRHGDVAVDREVIVKW